MKKIQDYIDEITKLKKQLAKEKMDKVVEIEYGGDQVQGIEVTRKSKGVKIVIRNWETNLASDSNPKIKTIMANEQIA